MWENKYKTFVNVNQKRKRKKYEATSSPNNLCCSSGPDILSLKWEWEVQWQDTEGDASCILKIYYKVELGLRNKIKKEKENPICILTYRNL